MGPRRKPSYWAVLPAIVRYDPELPPNAKLLYAEISSLTDASGYCFASNEYFASNFDLNTKSIQRLLKALVDRKYIYVDVVRDPETQEVLARKIFAGINPAGEVAPPSPQNCGDPLPQKGGDPSPQNCGVEQYNSFNNNTPHTPQGGRRGKRRNEPREAPDWKPERFAGFWAFYPAKGKKDKQAAMDMWDKLRPDDELINTIARALVKLKATDDWQRGVGIPYAATFLNPKNARWQDADEAEPASGPEGADDSTQPEQNWGWD